ncbi:hypothetical protein PTKIN_Ptkin03bG0207200 [Pterospermum kingtungense]
MAAGTVLVFDFDKTIIDCDSDDWVVEAFGVTDLFDQLRPTLPWNTLMDRMIMEVQSRGNTIDDIAACLRRVSLDPKIISVLKSAHALRCDLKIISDANVFFIKTILKNHGLLDRFSEINTNPSYVDGEGRLRISPYHDFESSSRGCNICPPNMCKGLIMERIRASGKKRFIYVGDGTADFCPGLKLGEDDFLMPRKNFPMWELVCSNRKLIRANDIREWNDGEELGIVLSNLIDKIFSEEKYPVVGVDQIVVPADYPLGHEAFRNALPVPPLTN